MRISQRENKVSSASDERKCQSIKSQSWRYTISALITSIDGLNSRLDQAEECIGEQKDTGCRADTIREVKRKRMKRWDDSLQNLLDTLKQTIFTFKKVWKRERESKLT